MARFTHPTDFEGTFWTIIDGDYYVSTIGNDVTGDGSPKNPYLTINRSLEEALENEKVVIGPNEYILAGETQADGSGTLQPCRLATNGTINLSVGGVITIDGIIPSEGDRILVWQQNDPTENGIYVVQSGPWPRATDFNQPDCVVPGELIPVLEGTVNANVIFQNISVLPVIIDSTSITFKLLTGENTDLLSEAEGDQRYISQELPGFPLPDSSLALWYNNDQATHESQGLYYPPSYLNSIAPEGWRIPTRIEVEGVFDELNLTLNGKFEDFSDPKFQNIDSWGNYWFFDGDGQTLTSLFFNADLSTVGWWFPTSGDQLRLGTRLVMEADDDGRGLDNVSVIPVEINGILYGTQRLSDGKIYILENYKGPLLDAQRRLTLSPEKMFLWADDVPSTHTHPKDQIEGLRDVDVTRDSAGYLPSPEYRFIDALEDDGINRIARLYNPKAVEQIVPAGWHIPTLAEWNDLLTQAGGGTFVDFDVQVPKPLSVWQAISPNGSLGIEIDTRGGHNMIGISRDFWEESKLDRYEVLNKVIRHSDFYAYYLTNAKYLIERDGIPGASGQVGIVQFGNTELYGQYNWWYSPVNLTPVEPETYVKVRLIKDDMIDPGIVNFGGSKTYNTVTINGKVWLAEDFEEDTVAEPAKTLQKVNSQLVWATNIIGAGTELSTVSFSELQSLIDSNQLNAGGWYLINDFTTVHLISGTSDVNTGTTEPLLVQAISNDTLKRDAYSSLFPDDIIHYDATDVLCEDGTTPRPGKIVFRNDPIKKLSTHYDWRQVVFRRFSITGLFHHLTTKPTPGQFEAAISYGAVDADPTRYREYYIEFNELTHDANPTLSLSRDGNTVLKPILKPGGVALASNELQSIVPNARALVYYSPKHDGYIVVDNDVENSAVQGYNSWNDVDFSIGNGTRLQVNNADFQDLFTFGNQSDGGALFDIQLGKWGNDYTNIIFLQNLSSNRHIVIKDNSYNMTFSTGNNHSVSLGEDCYNNLILSDIGWSLIDDEFFNNIISRPRLRYIRTLGESYNSSYFGTGNFYYLNFESLNHSNTFRIIAPSGGNGQALFLGNVIGSILNITNINGAHFRGEFCFKTTEHALDWRALQWTSANTWQDMGGITQHLSEDLRFFNIFNQPIQYLDDFSSAFQERSLVDKAYVDSQLVGGGSTISIFQVGKSTGQSISTEAAIVGWEPSAVFNNDDSAFSWNAGTGELTLQIDGVYEIQAEVNAKVTNGTARSSLTNRLLINGQSVANCEREAYLRQSNFGTSTTATHIVERSGTDIVLQLTSQRSAGTSTCEVIAAKLVAKLVNRQANSQGFILTKTVQMNMGTATSPNTTGWNAIFGPPAGSATTYNLNETDDTTDSGLDLLVPASWGTGGANGPATNNVFPNEIGPEYLAFNIAENTLEIQNCDPNRFYDIEVYAARNADGITDRQLDISFIGQTTVGPTRINTADNLDTLVVAEKMAPNISNSIVIRFERITDTFYRCNGIRVTEFTST